MIQRMGRRNGLTHVFNPCWSWVGDSRQRKKNILAPAGGSKTRDKNLSKNRSTQIQEYGIQSGLECGESPKTAEMQAVWDGPF